MSSFQSSQELILFILLFLNFISKLQRNEETLDFCQPHQATAHQWLIVCNGSANQITAFALVYQQDSTIKEYLLKQGVQEWNHLKVSSSITSEVEFCNCNQIFIFLTIKQLIHDAITCLQLLKKCMTHQAIALCTICRFLILMLCLNISDTLGYHLVCHLQILNIYVR